MNFIRRNSYHPLIKPSVHNQKQLAEHSTLSSRITGKCRDAWPCYRITLLHNLIFSQMAPLCPYCAEEIPFFKCGRLDSIIWSVDFGMNRMVVMATWHECSSVAWYYIKILLFWQVKIIPLAHIHWQECLLDYWNAPLWALIVTFPSQVLSANLRQMFCFKTWLDETIIWPGLARCGFEACLEAMLLLCTAGAHPRVEAARRCMAQAHASLRSPRPPLASLLRTNPSSEGRRVLCHCRARLKRCHPGKIPKVGHVEFPLSLHRLPTRFCLFGCFMK